MPTILRRCPTCVVLVASGTRCRGCARRIEQARGSATQRGYGHAWRKLRAQVLREQPICAVRGCAVLSTDVDHIVALARGGTNDRSNLRGLCHPHHSAKTVREDGGLGR